MKNILTINNLVKLDNSLLSISANQILFRKHLPRWPALQKHPDLYFLQAGK